MANNANIDPELKPLTWREFKEFVARLEMSVLTDDEIEQLKEFLDATS